MSYTSSSSYNSKHNSKHNCIFAIFWDEKLIKEILPRLSLLTRRRPVTSHLSPLSAGAAWSSCWSAAWTASLPGGTGSGTPPWPPTTGSRGSASCGPGAGAAWRGWRLSRSDKYLREKILSIFQFQKTADLTYSNEIPTSVYNPSGMYGLKAMGVSSQLRSDLLPNMAIISLSDWGFDIWK